METTQSYRRDAQDAVTTCLFDDIVLLYHHQSGQTHMVISPVPEILDELADGAPASIAQLHDRLARAFDLGPAEVAYAEIAAHLDALAALGLVRRA